MVISIYYIAVLVVVFTNCVLGIMNVERIIYNKNESNIVFPDTPKNELQEIPLSLIRRINEMSSMDEFLKTMVDNTEPEFIEIAERIGSDDVERNALRTAKTARCEPELTTVSFKTEKTAGLLYYPPCTRVKRCGGCCLHELLSCQPEDSEILAMKVLVAEYNGGLSLRKSEVVEVEQHTKCRCKCKIRPEHCEKYQRYSEEKCKCECTNTDKEKKCYNEAPKKIWDSAKCSCVCREEQECGSGFKFDAVSCDCVPARSRKTPNFKYETN